MSEPQIARSLYMVPEAEIDASGGLRPLDPGWVEGLSGLMRRDGQRRPIEIYRKPGGGYGMIAGRHRLAAVRALGWATVDADILDEAALDRRASEVSENLFRLGLAPLDRAAFVAEQIAIEKARAGLEPDASVKSVLATARWADRIGAEADDASANIALAFGFTEQVAEKVGLSRRAIYLDLEIHRGVRPEVAAAIRGLPVAGNASQLRTLARLSPADQWEVAELLTEGTAKGVTDALATMRQRPLPDAAKKAWSAFTGSWGRMNQPTQRLALIAILGQSSTAPALKALLKYLEIADAPALDMVLGGTGGELLGQAGPSHGPATSRRGADEGVRPVGNGSAARAVEGRDRQSAGVAGPAHLTGPATATPTFGGDV